MAALVVHVVMTIIGRRDWRGSDKLPATGAVLIVANHVSRFDPIALGDFIIWSGRWPRFLAKEGLFRHKLSGWLLRATESVPVDRASPRAVDALGPAAAKLAEGQAITIFPEGTESRDPELWPMVARTGAARLALATGVPVVPIAQWGAQRILPPVPGIRRRFIRQPLQFVCGDPIDLTEFEGRELTREVLELATTRIMDTLTDMVADLRQERPPAGRFDRRAHDRVPVQRQLGGAQAGPGGPDDKVEHTPGP
jgi:1-acyl-sn-glycerol-3-phosphate acyltransferase